MDRKELLMYAIGTGLVAGAAWYWFRGSSTTVPAPAEPQTVWRGPKRVMLDPEFWSAVQGVASRLEMDPKHLIAIMAFESRLDPMAVNPLSNATGLIQFLPSTAVRLGTTVAALKKMTRLEQLPWVEKYFRSFGGPFESLQDVAMVVFYPKYRKVAPTTTFPANVQSMNPGIRTPADYVARVARAAQGLGFPEAPVDIEVVEARPATQPTPALPGAPSTLIPSWLPVPAPVKAAHEAGMQYMFGRSPGSEGVRRIERTTFA